jgi:NADPH2:quinone reductase
MKAIQVHEFGAPDVLKLEDVADPIPAPGQVVMRVKAIGVNPLEAVIRSGVLMPMPFPYTPGEDAAGVIEAIAEGVTSVKVGDRVYGGKPLAGTYAELALYDATQIYPLPENIPFSQGAAIYSSYTTAYYALFNRGQGVAGETVLVHGASGGVGIAAVQMARAAGFRVLGTASSERGQTLVKQAGAH